MPSIGCNFNRGPYQNIDTEIYPRGDIDWIKIAILQRFYLNRVYILLLEVLVVK